METIQVDYNDVSPNPSPNTQQHASVAISSATTKKKTSKDTTSWFQSVGKTRLIIAAVLILVTLITITLTIILPIVLTKKSSSTESTTETTSETTTQTTRPTHQQILTKCQPDKSTDEKVQVLGAKTQRKKVKMLPAPERIGNRVLIHNTYMVEFAPDSGVKNHFRTITNSLRTFQNIRSSEIKQRCIIDSSLFSGVSFTVTANHSIEAIEMIKDAIAIYPVYTVQPPNPIMHPISSDTITDMVANSIHSYNLTGVSQIHEKMNNYGKGVRVAVIDSGVYYLHPALGGCFGPGCKVEFGYDFVGDEFGSSSLTLMPDSDPLDNCSYSSHGTHVAGIIAANATGINGTYFSPYIPFIGVAPQVTLGAYRVFGCSGPTSTDAIVQAIYRAYDDKADIINLSLGDALSYPDSLDSIAVQRVIEKGVYVTAALGNSGSGGLQTSGSPGNSPGVMAIGSIENTHMVSLYTIIAPDGNKFFYEAAVYSGGWKSIVNSTIVVNDPNATINDGCFGLSNSVRGAVALFFLNTMDSCGDITRCNNAENGGAIGCLFYNAGLIGGSLTIPTGTISLEDGLKIIATVTANPSAIYMFTNSIHHTSVKTTGTPSDFTSFGLSGDLLFKPQISGIGGHVYSTISPSAADQQKLTSMYGMSSGTSMACPYVAGTLALFLASIGNPAPNTITGYASNGICRPKFSLTTDIFQSTAKIVNIYESSLFATTAQQGAGLVNAFQALTITTIITPSELSLNDTVRKASSYKVKVINIGDKAATYKVSHQGAALATGKTSDDDQLLTTPLYSKDYAIVDIEPSEFKLEPDQSREITLRFQTPPTANPTLLPIYSGFIYVTNQMNGEVVHASYAGVVGDYADARIFVQNSALSIVMGILDTNYSYITDEQVSTLNASDGIPVTLVIAWTSRIIFAEVIASDDNSLPFSGSSYGLMRLNELNSALYVINAPRNVASSGVQSFREHYTVRWSGEVCLGILDATCSHQQASLLPFGEYRIRFSALKHFGNATNPNDFEIYRTPKFNLIY